MSRRKYLGPLAGLAMSLVVAGVALAGTSSDRWVNAPIGSNTPLFQNIDSTKFDVWDCENLNSDYNAYFDWMHHWPAFPSTGTQEVYYPCHNTVGTYTYTWNAGSSADYSVEYTDTNNSSVTTNWQATY